MQALSDAHTYLFEERQRLLDLQSENDELKLQVNCGLQMPTNIGGGDVLLIVVIIICSLQHTSFVYDH